MQKLFKTPLNKITKILYTISAIFLLLPSVIILYSFIYFKSPNKNLNYDALFIVRNGDSFIRVSNRLAKNGIISNQKLFLYVSRMIKGKKLVAKSGEYLIEKNSSPKEILEKLVAGDVHYRKLTFSEGLSTRSILQIIKDTKGLIGELPKDIKEGSLLPETYLYTKGDTKGDIVHRMQKAMNNTIDTLWEKRNKNIPVKTKGEALILASIVEKETGVPEERGLVASVFVNRLRVGMKLQSDPTVAYVFTKGNIELEREIRKSDLRKKSPYNTYHIYGLPPAPIANPGIDAIKAVLNPPTTNYLYFVATGNGGHNFSTNLRDHNNFVNDYRRKVSKK